MSKPAKLLVSVGLIEKWLFEGSLVRARIVGCSWDAVAGCVELYLEGQDVPDCELMVAEITEHARTIKLVPCPPPDRPVIVIKDSVFVGAGVT